jgi:hypothetical protein
MSSGQKLSKVDPKAFSKQDQVYFTKWKKENAPKISERDFEIQLNTSRGKTERRKEPIVTTSGTFYKHGIQIKEWPAFYNIKLRNMSQHTMEDLRMEYIIFKEADSMVYMKDEQKDIKMIRQKGTLNIPEITSMREVEVQTKSLPMREVKYLEGIYALGSGDTKSKDDLAGIWLRIYDGQELLVEKIYPDKIARSERWEDPKKRSNKRS